MENFRDELIKDISNVINEFATDILVKVFFEGLTFDEVAETYGRNRFNNHRVVSTDKVKTVYVKSLKKLEMNESFKRKYMERLVEGC